MNIEVGKVTAFITRQTADERQLLVFRHPSAGIQLPAGTIEQDEIPEAALLREVREETGLTAVEIVAALDSFEQTLEDRNRILSQPYSLEVEPGDSGRLVARLNRGSPVQVIEVEGNYTHVWYNFKLEDGILRPDLRYTGWLPGNLLTDRTRRYLFQLTPTAPAADRWSNEADHHIFDFYWANLNVELVAPQQLWLDRVRERLRF